MTRRTRRILRTYVLPLLAAPVGLALFWAALVVWFSLPV